jgi:hypothetical protein
MVIFLHPKARLESKDFRRLFNVLLPKLESAAEIIITLLNTISEIAGVIKITHKRTNSLHRDSPHTI